MSFQSIGGELGRLLADLAAEPESRERLVRACWPRAVGAAVARRTSARRFTEGVLEVEVLDASWAGVLKGMSGELLRRLNILLGRPLVRRIDWR